MRILSTRASTLSWRAEDLAAISASIKAAKAANIPFISFDRASTGAKPTAHVGETAMTMPLRPGGSCRTPEVQVGKCIEAYREP